MITQTAYVTRPFRKIHLGGFFALLFSIGLTVLGFSLMIEAWPVPLLLSAAPLGFLMFFIGIIAIGATLRAFRGLPYVVNSGWHPGGDPDVLATNLGRSPPSSSLMYETYRQLEEQERKEEND